MSNIHQHLRDKKILLGISGSIAAYKSAILVRQLIKAGAEVQVLMTPAAKAFIGPLTLSTLSKRPVHADVHAEESWNNHVELGLWADAMLIAPATATTLSKLATGLADNMLVATYLSLRCPVFFAPAMDVDMWHHDATSTNVQTLLNRGHHLIPVGEGELASGLVGAGRLAEPEEMVAFLADYFEQQEKKDLVGERVLITAGPTFEAIDPVRFIGNRSSGKMGVALAEAAASRGATVDLILGPSTQKTNHPSINILRVESAQEMYEQAIAHWSDASIGIMAAAVADYRPANVADQKIKKSGDTIQLELIKNPDIAANLGQKKTSQQILVGFALETNNEKANALGKLQKKKLDLIVLNSLRDKGAGFNHDTNRITIVRADESFKAYDLKSKVAVAEDILNEIVAWKEN